MSNTKRLLTQTAETASFAFREYFRPLVAVARFLKSSLAPSELAKSTPKDQTSLEESQALCGNGWPRVGVMSRSSSYKG